LEGHNRDGKTVSLDWHLWAGTGDGPQIPSTAAVLMVQKLARGQRGHTTKSSSATNNMDVNNGTFKAATDLSSGARPCVGMITLEEYMKSLRYYDIMSTVNGLTFNTTTGRIEPVSSSSNASDTSMGMGGYQAGHQMTIAPLPTSQWAVASMGSLVVSLMSPDFLRFNTTGGIVAGDLRVTRSSNVLINALADLVGIPAATPTGARGSRCVVTATSDQKWVRRFNGVPMVSKFISGNDGLAREVMQPGFELAFHIRPIPTPFGTGFEHITKGMKLFGIPIPSWLMVRADGRSIPLPPSSSIPSWSNDRGNGWLVEVDIKMPVIGTLARYEGNVYPVHTVD
jgi:hypothetical protein